MSSCCCGGLAGGGLGGCLCGARCMRAPAVLSTAPQLPPAWRSPREPPGAADHPQAGRPPSAFSHVPQRRPARRAGRPKPGAAGSCAQLQRCGRVPLAGLSGAGAGAIGAADATPAGLGWGVVLRASNPGWLATCAVFAACSPASAVSTHAAHAASAPPTGSFQKPWRQAQRRRGLVSR